MNTINCWKLLVVVLLSVSPVFWFYAVDINLISIVKKVLFLLVFSISLFYFNFKNIFSSNKKLLVNIYLLIINILLLALFTGGSKYFEMLYISSFIVGSYYLGRIFGFKATESDVILLRRSVFITFGLLSLLILFAQFLPGMNPVNPNVLVHKYTINIPYLTYSGFTNTRTHWVPVYIVFLGIGYLNYLFDKKKYQLFFLIVLYISIFILATKAGIILSMFLLFFVLANMFLKRPTLTIFACILVFSLSFIILDEYSDKFRLNDILSGDIDQITTGRTSNLSESIDFMKDNFLLGAKENFKLKSFNLISNDVHNVIINYTIKFGAICTIPFFIMVYILYVSSSRPSSSKLSLGQKTFRLSILLSLLTGLWEPVTIYSLAHNGFPTWFFLGLISTENSLL